MDGGPFPIGIVSDPIPLSTPGGWRGSERLSNFMLSVAALARVRAPRVLANAATGPSRLRIGVGGIPPGEGEAPAEPRARGHVDSRQRLGRSLALPMESLALPMELIRSKTDSEESVNRRCHFDRAGANWTISEPPKPTQPARWNRCIPFPK